MLFLSLKYTAWSYICKLVIVCMSQAFGKSYERMLTTTFTAAYIIKENAFVVYLHFVRLVQTGTCAPYKPQMQAWAMMHTQHILQGYTQATEDTHMQNCIQMQFTSYYIICVQSYVFQISLMNLVNPKCFSIFLIHADFSTVTLSDLMEQTVHLQ